MIIYETVSGAPILNDAEMFVDEQITIIYSQQDVQLFLIWSLHWGQVPTYITEAPPKWGCTKVMFSYCLFFSANVGIREAN